MYCVAIAQVVSRRKKEEGEDKGWEGRDHRSDVTVLEGIVGSARIWERGNKKKASSKL